MYQSNEEGECEGNMCMMCTIGSLDHSKHFWYMILFTDYSIYGLFLLQSVQLGHMSSPIIHVNLAQQTVRALLLVSLNVPVFLATSEFPQPLFMMTV